MLRVYMVIACICFGWFPITAVAETIEGTAYCSYGAEIIKTGPRKLNIADPDPAIQEIISVMQTHSATGNYELKSSQDVSSAEAIVLAIEGMSRPRRLIVYKSGWLLPSAKKTDGRWIQKGVLAHEIGHHVYSHLLSLDQSESLDRPDIELDADYYSGWTLSQMNATLQEAQLAVVEFTNDTPPSTYPPRKSRLLSVESGWSRSESIKFAKKTAASKNQFRQLILDNKTEKNYILFGDDIVSIEPSGIMLLVGKKAKSGIPGFKWAYVIAPEAPNIDPERFWDDEKGKVWGTFHTGYTAVGKLSTEKVGTPK